MIGKISILLFYLHFYHLFSCVKMHRTENLIEHFLFQEAVESVLLLLWYIMEEYFLGSIFSALEIYVLKNKGFIWYLQMIFFSVLEVQVLCLLQCVIHFSTWCKRSLTHTNHKHILMYRKVNNKQKTNKAPEKKIQKLSKIKLKKYLSRVWITNKLLTKVPHFRPCPKGKLFSSASVTCKINKHIPT